LKSLSGAEDGRGARSGLLYGSVFIIVQIRFLDKPFSPSPAHQGNSGCRSGWEIQLVVRGPAIAANPAPTERDRWRREVEDMLGKRHGAKMGQSEIREDLPPTKTARRRTTKERGGKGKKEKKKGLLPPSQNDAAVGSRALVIDAGLPCPASVSIGPVDEQERYIRGTWPVRTAVSRACTSYGQQGERLLAQRQRQRQDERVHDTRYTTPRHNCLVRY
jgi:hypothetical protein